MDESTFQAIIESIFIEIGSCFPEICLLVDPTKKYGNGRFGFIDLFFLATTNDPHNLAVLELKVVSLKSLWHGTQQTPGSCDASHRDLEELRENLKETEEQIMTRKWCFWNKNDWRWETRTLVDLKWAAFEQVNRYLKVVCQGSVDPCGAQAGVQDFRIGCKVGEEVQGGAYVVMCIGATRVLTWKTNEMKTKLAYTSLL